MLEKQMLILKTKNTAHMAGSQQLVAPTEATFLKPDPDAVAVEYYNPSVNNDTHLSRYKTVEQHDK